MGDQPYTVVHCWRWEEPIEAAQACPASGRQIRAHVGRGPLVDRSKLAGRHDSPLPATERRRPPAEGSEGMLIVACRIRVEPWSVWVQILGGRRRPPVFGVGRFGHEMDGPAAGDGQEVLAVPDS